MFSLPPPFTLTYEDDENDLVTLSTDAELREALSLAQSKNINPLRLHLYKPEDDIPQEPPRPTNSAQNNHERAVPEANLDGVQTILEGIGNIFGAIASGMTPPMTPPRMMNSGMRGREGWRRGHGGRRCGMSMDACMAAPLMAVFGTGMNVMGRLGVVSDETKRAFEEVRTSVEQVDSEVLMSAVRGVVPLAMEFIRGVGEDGQLRKETTDGFVRRVENGLNGALGGDIAEKVGSFLRVALRDEVVVGVVRDIGSKMRAMRMGPVGRRFAGGSMGGRAAFDVHREVECDACGKAPIVGSRFKCTNVNNYDSCGACYSNDNVNKEGKEFKECKYVWEAQLGDADVPPAPMAMGERSANVAFLQKLLTDLGYMNERMYARRVGIFGPNTRAAVMQLQMEYGLTEMAAEGVYDATTAACLASLLDASNLRGMTTEEAPAGTSATADDAQMQNAPTQD